MSLHFMDITKKYYNGVKMIFCNSLFCASVMIANVFVAITEFVSDFYQHVLWNHFWDMDFLF